MGFGIGFGCEYFHAFSIDPGLAVALSEAALVRPSG
jgi:hypothetical protein